MRDIRQIARSLTSTTPELPQDNFIERLRRIQLSTPNTPPLANKPAETKQAETQAVTPEPSQALREEVAVAGQPNDLRRYLQQRASRPKPDVNDLPPRSIESREPARGGRVAPVVKSLDALVNQIFAEHDCNKQRLVLIAAASPKTNAAPTAIALARLLAADAERAVLVDLTPASTAISGPLGLPRAPGFADLIAGSAGFEDVVCLDGKSALQVIVAGNAPAKSETKDAERMVRIFSALAQAYHLVVLYGDTVSASRFQASLQGRLAMVIAVLAGAGDPTAAMTAIAELTSFGAPVFPYDKSAADTRPGIFGRTAAL